MTKTKFIQLIGALKEATTDGKMEWSAVSGVGREQAFQSSVGTNSVIIENDSDGDNNRMYSLTILEPSGKRLDTEYFTNRGDSNVLEAIEDLYELARNNALKIDQTLDHMLSILERKQ